MKAFTVYQPWASLIAIEAKPYEFRMWDYETRNGGLRGQRVVVHASARPMKIKEVKDLHARVLEEEGKGTGLVCSIAGPFLTRLLKSMRGTGEHLDLPPSAAVATATIGRAIRANDIFKGTVADSDRIDQHVWAWPMLEVEAIVPAVPCRGAQGFWNFPSDLEFDVQQQSQKRRK